MLDSLVHSIVNYFRPPSSDPSPPQYAIYFLGLAVSVGCLVQAFPGLIQWQYTSTDPQGKMYVESQGWPAFQTGLIFLACAIGSILVARAVCNWIHGPSATVADIGKSDSDKKHYL